MPRHPWNRPVALATTALLALTLAGCGASDDEASSSTSASRAPSGTQSGSTGDTGTASPSGSGTSGPSSSSSSQSPSASRSTSNAPDPEVSVTPEADHSQAQSARRAGTQAADGSAPAGRLRIPAVGLSTQISPQGLRGGKVNPAPGQVIWFTGNDRARPGATGTTVIAGHVISGGRPDSFAALEQLETGDGVVLDYPGGETLRFEVTRTDVVDKDELTTDQDVWGHNASTRRVVLVTCDDRLGFREDGHRTANFVAVAELPS